MKTFFGIETMRLKGRKVAGGYLVRGLLPYVSNLGPDHYFGMVFEVEGEPRHFVMAIADCAADNLSLVANTKFVALDGTRTFAVQMRDVMIPEEFVLADPIEPYLERIRAGFILLQSGMAFGLIRSSIELMRQMKRPLGHVNKYLEPQPEEVEERLDAMTATVERLAATPLETDAATGVRSSRPGWRRAKPRSRPRTPRCSIAAPAATWRTPRRSAACANPISSPS